MGNYQELEAYKWFMSAYFNKDHKWSELPMAVNMFFSKEGVERSKDLLQEARAIAEQKDWESIKEINRQFAQVEYDEAKIKELVRVIAWLLSFKVKQ